MDRGSTDRLINSLIIVALLTVARTGRAQLADTIYIGGHIVTVNDAQPTADALAVKDGRILAVGSRKVVEQGHRGVGTRVVDLASKTMLPAFLDAHSHYFSSLTVANQVNVYAPPAGPGKDPASIVAELVKHRNASRPPRARSFRPTDTTTM